MTWKTFVNTRYPLPPKPFKDLEDYRKKAFFDFRPPKLENKWPCVHCCGRGGYKRAEDCDPVEGYKLAPFYKCGVCKGSGEGIRSEVNLVYRSVLKEWRQEREELQKKREATLKAVCSISLKNMNLLHDLFSKR